jgi:putative ABC transport system permease protein
MRNAPFSLKLYRRLIALYPAGFRENYGDAMEQEFRDELAESSGPWTLAALWIRLLADLTISIPAQVSREIAQDVRHALRLWIRRPLLTGFAIITLAIGIGANTGVFSVVNALLLRSLPFHEPDRLALIRNVIPPHDSAKEFHEWRARSAYLADAALIEEYDVNLGGVREAARAHVTQTSWNFFSTLGTPPVVGRGFTRGEDTPGRDAIAVIGYGLWQQLFAGDARALGSTIRIDGKPLTIVGVASPGFDYPRGTVLWKAASYAPGNNGWDTVARLKPGVTWPQARAAFNVEVERLWPDRGNLDPRQRPRMTSLQDGLAGPVKSASLLLMASVALILLIACTNIANLLLARTADRAGELAIRAALGASRARLAQQVLTECLLLSLFAAVAGLAVASATISLAGKLQPPPLAAQSYSILDGRVLGFALAASILSALLFGALPSLYAGRIYAFGTRGATRTRGSRIVRETLVAAQVTLTVVLLTTSVSVGRGFLKLMGTDRGYNVKELVTVNVSLDGTTYQLAERQLPFFEEALARVRRLPGVQSASATVFLPLYSTGFVGGPFGIDGRPTGAMMVPVLPDYFRTMGGTILCGREFTDAEVRSDASVAVVNENFARDFGPAREALGRQLTLGRQPPWKIIGVVKGMDYETDAAPPKSHQIFLPAHDPGGFFSTIVARVDGRAEDRLPMIRDAIRSVDAQVPVFGARMMEQRLADVLSRPRFYSTAVLFFAGFALLLAVIGIYGIVSYAVVQRAHEMGVRMALGTTPLRLRGTVLRQGLLTVATGAIPGIAGAMLAGRFLGSLIEGTQSAGLATSAVSVLLIALVASTCIWAATRRIARLDIMEILRSE